MREMEVRAGVSLSLINFQTFLEALNTSSSASVSSETLSQAKMARQQSERRSQRVFVKEGELESFKEFLQWCVESGKKDLRRYDKQLDEVTDPDIVEMLHSRIRAEMGGVRMCEDWLEKLIAADSAASRLKGEVRLVLKDDGLRQALVSHMYDKRQKLAPGGTD
ncbi:hypothetical protein [Streptomyces mirabilis]|uniref:hypothetical protein n=1 Tax=Streptomyces mirabilis TaxID=68239 RepID=UPI0033A8F2CA